MRILLTLAVSLAACCAAAFVVLGIAAAVILTVGGAESLLDTLLTALSQGVGRD